MLALYLLALLGAQAQTGVLDDDLSSHDEIRCHGGSLLQLNLGHKFRYLTSDPSVSSNIFHEIESRSPRYEALSDDIPNIDLGVDARVDADVSALLDGRYMTNEGSKVDPLSELPQRRYASAVSGIGGDDLRSDIDQIMFERRLLALRSHVRRNNRPYLESSAEMHDSDTSEIKRRPRRISTSGRSSNWNSSRATQAPSFAATGAFNALLDLFWARVPSAHEQVIKKGSPFAYFPYPLFFVCVAGLLAILGFVLLCLGRISHVHAFSDQRVFGKASLNKSRVDHSKSQVQTMKLDRFEAQYREFPSQTTIDQLKKLAHDNNPGLPDMNLPKSKGRTCAEHSTWCAPLHASHYLCPNLVVPFASECTVLIPRLRPTSTALFVRDLSGSYLLQAEVAVSDCMLAKGSQERPGVVLYQYNRREKPLAYSKMQSRIVAQDSSSADIYRGGGQVFATLRKIRKLRYNNEYFISFSHRDEQLSFEGDFENLKVLSVRKELIADCCLVSNVEFDASESYLRVRALGNADVGLLLVALVSIQLMECFE